MGSFDPRHRSDPPRLPPDAPSARELPHAYLPDWIGRDDEEPIEETPDRNAVLEQAREQRLEEGLPVDSVTLERVADAVASPEYPLPGFFLTSEECADDVPGAIDEAVLDYLEEHPEIDGGRRFGWRDGRRTLFVGLVNPAPGHAEAIARLGGDRVVVEPRSRSTAELEALSARVWDAADASRVFEGFTLLYSSADPERGVVELEVVGEAGPEAASALFRERFGPSVEATWAGPSAEREVPHPFGSWVVDGRRLVVSFGLDRNGARFGSATVTEQRPDRVTVAITRFEPRGVRTLIGGFRPHHAELELEELLGDRRVFDASTGVARPTVSELIRGSGR